MIQVRNFKGKKIVDCHEALTGLSVTEDCEIRKEFKKLKKFKGKEFQRTICQHPFFEMRI